MVENEMIISKIRNKTRMLNLNIKHFSQCNKAREKKHPYWKRKEVKLVFVFLNDILPFVENQMKYIQTY